MKIEYFDLPFFPFHSLYTFVSYPHVFGSFSKISIEHLNMKMALDNISRFMEIDRVILDDPWEANNFLIKLRGKWEYSLVALEDANIVGFVICSMKGENIHIHRIAVAPKYQRRGIGTSLVEHLFSNCNKYNIKFITVKTKKNNVNAQRFYERQDFKRSGTDGPDYDYMKEI